MATVLVVDDKESLRDSVGFTLQRAGFTILSACNGEGALEIVAKRRPDAMVTDLKMPGMSGVELIERVREIDDDLPMVLMTAFGTVDTAVRAIKSGAFDYITKPFEGDELVIAVKRAIEHRELKRENQVLKASATVTAPSRGADASGLLGIERVIGETPLMRELKANLTAVAESHGTVLISGESGTGKEVVARAIHEMSPRRDGPFLAVNCAAMSESLLESELFGHERGAFTGAESLRKGRFELAHGGTLLLDEISEIKPQIQAKLLRVLQEQAFERVGSSTTIGVDVRVIATTNRHLGEEVASGGFRQDLFYRLNVLPVPLPSLSERRDDVRLLAPHFVRMTCAREGRAEKRITDEAMELLVAYPWPGNVRELQNLCERAVVLSLGEEITPELIRLWLTGPNAPGRAMKARPRVLAGGEESEQAIGAGSDRSNGSVSASIDGVAYGAGSGSGVNGSHGTGVASMIEPRPLADIEREVIVETLRRFGGHRQKTARALGIGVRTLGLKLKKWKEQELVSASL